MKRTVPVQLLLTSKNINELSLLSPSCGRHRGPKEETVLKHTKNEICVPTIAVHKVIRTVQLV